MKGILVFLLCSSVVEAENCPTGWTEFCAKNLFYGCYKAYFTRVNYVNYSSAYSVCDSNEYSSVLFQYDSQALEEMDFVSNLTDSITIWINNGQNPTICNTMSGHNQTIVQENCNNSAYTVCKYQSDKQLSSSDKQLSTFIKCSSAVLTTLSPINGTTTNLTENTTNIIQYTTDIVVNTTRATVEEMISTVSMETSSSSPENIYTTNSSANQTTTCFCEWLCYSEIGVDDLEIKVQNIKQNLTVDRATLSATLRKLTCAPDPRPSSTYIGYTGATIMSLLFLVIVVIDCLPRPKK